MADGPVLQPMFLGDRSALPLHWYPAVHCRISNHAFDVRMQPHCINSDITSVILIHVYSVTVSDCYIWQKNSSVHIFQKYLAIHRQWISWQKNRVSRGPTAGLLFYWQSQSHMVVYMVKVTGRGMCWCWTVNRKLWRCAITLFHL